MTVNTQIENPAGGVVPAVEPLGVQPCPPEAKPDSFWQGCYDSNWNGQIVPEAFSHPAKMANGLVNRIFDYAIAQGWIVPGESVVVDPFGGIGSTGIVGASKGVKVLCCELEAKFVALGEQNFALHRRTWEACGDPLPVIVQGDSRRLCEVLGPAMADCVVSSPPFCESLNSGIISDAMKAEMASRGHKPSASGESADYGTTPGQLGAMRAGDVAAVIGSPPFIDPRAQSGRSDYPFEANRQGYAPGITNEYGDSDGQLSAMKTGSVADVILGSPPYSGNEKHDYRTDEERYRGKPQGVGCFNGSETYGESDGQLGVMPTGSVEAIISSPPYADQAVNGARANREANLEAAGIDAKAWLGERRCTQGRSDGYGTAPGNLGNLPAGDVAAIVSSPPYAQNRMDGGDVKMDKPARKGYEYNAGGKGVHAQYGTADGQLAAMPPGDVADALISSPPYEGSVNAESHGIDWSKAGPATGNRKREGSKCDETLRSQLAYGTETGQIGAEHGETFWSAAREIVQQCHQILRPGGVAIWVCKDFIRKGQRVPFSADWQRLCIACGFEPVEWIKASLVKEQRHPGLFGEDVVTKTERKGFFRRLAEKKGSPPIDEEDVIIVRKPQLRQGELTL